MAVKLFSTGETYARAAQLGYAPGVLNPDLNARLAAILSMLAPEDPEDELCGQAAATLAHGGQLYTLQLGYAGAGTTYELRAGGQLVAQWNQNELAQQAPPPAVAALLEAAQWPVGEPT